MAFKKDSIGENLIIEDIRDHIPENHPCYVVKDFVDKMEFSNWKEDNPCVIIKAIILGHIDGLNSGRRISNHVHTDLTYIYLCDFNRPDFKTINKFYRDHPDFIAKTLFEFVKKYGSINKLRLNKSKSDEEQIQMILDSIHDIIKNNEKDDEIFGRDNDGNSIKCNPGSKEFEEKYEKAVEFANKHLADFQNQSSRLF